MPQQSLTVDVAAQILNLSRRHIVDLYNDEKLAGERVMNPRSGKPQILLDSRSVAAYQRKRVEAAVTSLGGSAAAVATAPEPKQLEAPPTEPEHAADPGAGDAYFLTLDQAAAASGLPAIFLEDLIRDGKLAAFDVGPRKGVRRPWRVHRDDLAALRPDRPS